MKNEGKLKRKEGINNTKLAKMGFGLSILIVFTFIVVITLKGKVSKADEEDYLVDNLRVTEVTTSSVTLSWDACSDCKEYVVYKKTIGSVYYKVEKTSKTCYTIGNLEPGQFVGTYAIVQYIDKDHDVDKIDIVNNHKVASVLTRPEAVKGLVCTNLSELDFMNENKHIDLQWDKAKGADCYNIYIKKASDSKYDFVKAVHSNSTRIKVDKKYEDNIVKIWVESVASKNFKKIKSERINSYNTMSLNISKDILRMCQKSPYSHDKINIIWENNSKIEALDFYILGSSSWKLLGTVKTTECNFTISNLQPNSIYNIKIITDKGKEYGRYRFATVPKKIDKVEVKNISDDKVVLTWDKLKVNKYGIFVYDESKKEYIMKRKVYGANSVIYTGLFSYTTYKIIVAPICDSFENKYYSITGETGVTFQTKVGRVKNLKLVEITSDSVKIEWDKISYADGYNVYVYNKKGENMCKKSTVECSYTYKTDKSKDIDIIIKVEAYLERLNANTKKKEYEVSYVMSEISAFNTLNYPINVHIENRVKGYVKLVWAKVYGAEKYMVYTVDINDDGTKKYNYVGETKKQFYEFEIDNLQEKTVFGVKAICDYNGEKIESDYSKECEYIKD